MKLLGKSGGNYQGYYATKERLARFEFIIKEIQKGRSLVSITRMSFSMKGDVTKSSEYMYIRRMYNLLVMDNILVPRRE